MAYFIFLLAKNEHEHIKLHVHVCMYVHCTWATIIMFVLAVWHGMAWLTVFTFLGTSFCRLIPDNGIEGNGNAIKRNIFCSGKIYYELVKRRKSNGLDSNVAITRVEQVMQLHGTLVFFIFKDNIEVHVLYMYIRYNNLDHKFAHHKEVVAFGSSHKHMNLCIFFLWSFRSATII